VDLASTMAELRFTSLIPLDNRELRAEPVIQTTMNDKMTVETITLNAREFLIFQ
jgi:hypothetical protein